MQIKGSQFKVIKAVEETTSPVTDEQKLQDDAIEDFFLNPTGETSNSSYGSTDPLDAYSCGDYQSGVATAMANQDLAAYLENFPTAEEFLAQDPESTNRMDVLEAAVLRYEKFSGEFAALQEEYETAISSGYASATQTAELKILIDLLKNAQSICNEAKDVTLPKFKEKLNAIWVTELQTGKDLNSDNKIADKYYVKYKDGKQILLDLSTHQPVKNPVLYTDYSPTLTENGAVKINKAPKTGEDDTADLYLQLTEEALNSPTAAEPFGPVDIGIPEVLWVQKKDDGTGEEPFATGKNGHMIVYNKWSDEGGVKQAQPTDAEKWMQIQVTKTSVNSVESGYTDEDGNKLYSHVIEFYNGENLIMSVRLEGFETANDFGAATATENGMNYVAASSVGLSFNGKHRASSLIFDGEGLISTSHHKVSPTVIDELGIASPDEDGQKAFDANMDIFLDNEGTGDEYVPTSTKSKDSEKSQSPTTGLFIHDVRGNITGTKYNDFIVTIGANDVPEGAKDLIPEDQELIKKDEPLYTTIVRAGKGSNVVISKGDGDKYIYDATFFWGETKNSKDETFVVTPDKITKKDSTGSYTQSCFVYAKGGKTFVNNPREFDVSNHPEEKEAEYNASLGVYKNDYFYVPGAAKFTNTDDPDIVFGANEEAGDRTFFEGASTDPETELYNALTNMQEVSAADAEVDWTTVNEASSTLFDETNSFFDAYESEMQGFITEKETEEENS